MKFKTAILALTALLPACMEYSNIPPILACRQAAAREMPRRWVNEGTPPAWQDGTGRWTVMLAHQGDERPQHVRCVVQRQAGGGFSLVEIKQE